MAISLIAKPQTVTPAYNEIKYIYDSTNKNEDGFKYIFDIYDSTPTKIAEYRVLPKLDGYGEVDLSRLLQNYVSFDFDETLTTEQDATGSYYQYEVRVGEEYVVTYDYTSNLTQNGNFVQINLTSQPFSVGDQVIVTDDGLNPSFNGLFTVTESNANDFTVNFLWSQIVDPTEDGNVAYADNRKSVTRDIVTVSSVYVFNGAVPFGLFPSYDYTDYELTVNTDLPLATIPSEFNATVDQDIFINYMNNGTTGFIKFQNDSGYIGQKAVASTGLITQASVGPNNFGSLTTVLGTPPLVDDDMTYYNIWFANSGGTQISEQYRITIDRRCKINDYEICFLDRLGAIGSFAFQLRDKLTGTLNKEVYNQNIAGSVSANEWTYGTTAQGRRNIYPSIEETIELHTNWMTEDEASYFTELVTSPQTWIKIDGVYYSCIVEDRGYEKERQRNRNLIRKTIKVKRSVQDRING